jgi:phage protein D
VSTDLLVAARPSLRLDGREVPSLAEDLLGLAVHERTDGLYACELRLANWGLAGSQIGFLYFDRKQLDFGKTLEVLVSGSSLFKGRVTALEGGFPDASPPMLTVLAEDRLQDLRMTRRTRTFEDASDADVFEQLAGDHGLTPKIDASGPTHKVLAQVAESDLAFMRSRARAIGVELWLSDTTLNVAPRASRAGAPALTYAYGRELYEFTVVADLADQRTKTTVSGWDVAGKTAIAESADDGDLGGETAGGDSGAAILGSALAERTESVVAAVPLTTAEANAHVQALFRRRARRFVTGRGVAQTDARLRVGSTLTLQGLGALFEGDYYVSEVEHVFDPLLGLRTQLAVERPVLGRPQ